MSQHGCPERLSNRSKGFQEDGSSQPTMEVLVETLTGTAFEMTVSPSDTIFAIKSKIFRVEGIPVSQQHLLYNLKELDDSSSLRSLSIGDGARLRLVLGLRGGPISTRRLPPPPPDAPFRDLERLMDRSRDDSSSPGGCKVTVLVFRDGERVNMLRVRENDDGTYSPIDHTKYSSSSRGETGAGAGTGSGGSGSASGTTTTTTTTGQSAAAAAAAAADDGLSTSVAENALTMGKMLDLRRRMDSLSVHRGRGHSHGEKSEVIQKTRSEESLPSAMVGGSGSGSGSRRPRPPPPPPPRHPPPPPPPLYAGDEPFSSLYDFNYQYDYDCAFNDRYTLLPPIGPVVVGAAPRWRSFDSSPLPPLEAPPPPAATAAAAALHLRAPRPVSSSTSDLEHLQQARVLPALTRHRNRDQLHLSDELEDRRREVGSERRLRSVQSDLPKVTEPKEPKKIRIRCGFCKKRLTIATEHRCRCGVTFCAPHRYAEVHDCRHDYKQTATPAALQPLTAPKLPKI